MFIPFGKGAYVNNSYGLPPVVLENWMAEESPELGDKGWRLVPTPGLMLSASPTILAPGRGAFQSDGVLGGDLIFVAGPRVYRMTSAGSVSLLAGTVADDGLPVQFAASQTPELVMASGGTAYRVQASGVSSFTWTGTTGPIVGVAVNNQRHLYVESSSGRLWISDPANATAVTKFVTAEQDPDFLRCVAAVSGTVVLFGAKSFELWAGTTDETNPLVLRPGSARSRGIIGKDAYCVSDFTAFFVGNDGIVYRDVSAPQRISTRPIEKALSKLTVADRLKVSLASYDDEGHAFVHLHIPGVYDLLYDASTQEWHRRKRLDGPDYGYGSYVAAFGGVYAQEQSDGRIVRLDNESFTDRGSPIRRVASCIVPVSKKQPLRNIILEAQQGVALDGSGYGSEPLVELTVYYDGRTPEGPIQKKMGKRGAYNYLTLWGPLGQIEPPYVKFEIAISDPVGYAVYGVSANEERP